MLNFNEAINIDDILISSEEIKLPKQFKKAIKRDIELENFYNRLLEKENLPCEFFQETLIDFSDLMQANKYSNENNVSHRENIKKSIFTFNHSYGYFRVNVLSLTSTHIRIILKHFNPQHKLIMSGRCKFRNKKRSSKALLDLFLSYSDKVIKEKVMALLPIERLIPEKSLLPLKVFKSKTQYDSFKLTSEYRQKFLVG